MPVSKDQYPSQLPAQARTALCGWYTKELKKDEKLTKEERAEKIAEKVRRVMKVQFPAEGERIAALCTVGLSHSCLTASRKLALAPRSQGASLR